MQKIRVASSNSKKAQELVSICKVAGIDAVALLPEDPPLVTVQETGLTYIENAILKARSACQQLKMPVIADDSGLEIAALDKKPGVYSARFAGTKANDQLNITQVLNALCDVPCDARAARFYCVVVFLQYAEDPSPIIGEGIWNGVIAQAPRGKYGFGYDPIFWVPEHNCTSSELLPDVKNSISHRAQAVRNLARAMALVF